MITKYKVSAKLYRLLIHLQLSELNTSSNDILVSQGEPAIYLASGTW